MPFLGWTRQSVNWYLDASDYTGFHKKLAEIILPWVRSAETLVDLGCGPGCIDMELAAHVGSITAVDIDTMPLESLRKECDKRGIENIKTLCADAEQLDIEADVVLLSLYAPEELDSLFEAAGRCVVRIMNGSNISKLSPSETPKAIPSHILFARKLEQMGMRYELLQKELEFGQPLANIQEAADFVRHYDHDSPFSEIRAHLEEKLLHTEDDPFPYYIPYSKPICIFHIQT